MNMQPFKKLHLLYCLLVFNVMLGSSISNHDQKNYCGNIRTQKPFLNQNSSISSLLSSITLCRSQNLYFRTSLGLFQVSSIDFDGRILTISHSSCSSSLNYVSPLAVTSGFTSPPEPNSLILFNCSRKIDPFPPFMKNCTNSFKCGPSNSPSSRILNHEKSPYSCLVVEDLQKVEEGFHPKDLNCSHYTWAHRSSSSDGEEDHGKFKYGARLSFDIPAVPEICKGCVKPNGTCGSGLNCLCHAKECKDKVISKVGSIKFTGSVFFCLLFSFLSMIE